MMSISPGSYIPDQNNNLSPHHHGDHHQEYQEYYAEDADTLHYQKINPDYIINDAFIIVTPRTSPSLICHISRMANNHFTARNRNLRRVRRVLFHRGCTRSRRRSVTRAAWSWFSQRLVTTGTS